MFTPVNRLLFPSVSLSPSSSLSSSQESLCRLFDENVGSSQEEAPQADGLPGDDLIEFVQRFNRCKADLELLRHQAFSYLTRLKAQVWEDKNTRGFPNPYKVEGTRDGFFILFCCRDQQIRQLALKALVDLLEVDPLLETTAGGLLDLQKKLLEAMDLKKAEDYPITIQRLLSKAYALSLECILLQVSLGRLNALQQSTKDAIWSAAEGLLGININDEETGFWATVAVQAAERLKSNRTLAEDWMGKFSTVTSAFVTIASACHYPDYVSTAMDAPPKLMAALTELKGLFYHIEWHECWFERILVLKKLSRFSLHDPKEFAKVIQMLQNEKIALTLSSNLAEKAAEKFIQKNETILYGIVSLLEASVLQTSKSEVQEMSLKLLIQYLNLNSKKVQRRVILTFFSFLQGHERLANTSVLILLLLNASNVVRCPSAKKLMEELSTSSHQLDDLKSKLLNQRGEDLYYSNLLRFLILRLADVRQLERTPTQDYSSQSFITLLASSYNEIVIEPLLNVILEVFPIPDKGMSLRTPFHIAAVMNRPRMIHHLIRFKALFPIDGCDIDGNTALHLAVKRQQKDTVKALLDGGVNTEIQNSKGLMPIHHAALDGNSEIISLLLKAGAHVNGLTNDGMTAVDLVLQMDHVLLFHFLVDCGGKSSEHRHSSRVMLAAKNGSESILISLLNHYKEKRRRLKKKEVLSIYLLITEDTVTMKCSKRFAKFHRSLLDSYPQYRQAFRPFSGGPQFEDDGGLSHRALTQRETVKNLMDLSISIPHPIREFGNTVMIRLARKEKHLLELQERIPMHPHEINKSNYFGMTPLLAAAAFNQTQAVALLLDHGAKPTKKNGRGFSPLHFAAMHHNLEMVIMLVEKAPKMIEVKNDFGDNPFLILSGLLDQHYPVALRSLCKKYRNFPVSSEKDSYLFALLRPKKLKISQALHHAVFAKSFTAIDWICEQYPEAFWEKNVNGLMPVEEAFRLRICATFDALVRSQAKGEIASLAKELYERTSGRLSLANMAVELNCIFLLRELLRYPEFATLCSRGQLQETPLHTAARINQIGVLELFQKLGISLDVRDAFDNTPAHIAAFYGNRSFVEAIPMGHLILKAKNRDQRYPVHVAASQISSDGPLLFTHLLGIDPSILAAKDLFGDTLLHTVCKFGVKEYFTILMERIGEEEINAVNDEGDAPLHLAAAFGRVMMIEALVERGANLELQNGQGATALMHAAQEGRTFAINKLVSLGANLHVSNVEGEGVLHLAVRNLHVQAVRELLRLEMETIHPSKNDTMSRKVDLNSESVLLEFPKEAGGSPEKVLAGFEIFKMLLEIGLDVHHRNDDGEHLIHLFAQHSDPSFLKYLFTSKELWWVRDLKINIHDQKWNTPLHKAAAAGRHANVKMLLELGAKGNLKNRQGMTPLLLAVKLRNHRVWEEMLRHKRVYIGISDNAGKTVIHHLLDTKESLKTNELLFLEEVLKRRPALVFRKCKKGWTALHYLAFHGHENALDLVMQMGSYPKESYQHFVQKKCHSGETAADLASPSLAAKIRRYPVELLGSQKPKWSLVKDVIESADSVADPLSALI